MTEHAQRLHKQAEALAHCNGRLMGILERMHGPEPQAASGDANKPVSPTGVLYVAQFGAERIGLEIDRLSSQLNRLEQVA